MFARGHEFYAVSDIVLRTRFKISVGLAQCRNSVLGDDRIAHVVSSQLWQSVSLRLITTYCDAKQVIFLHVVLAAKVCNAATVDNIEHMHSSRKWITSISRVSVGVSRDCPNHDDIWILDPYTYLESCESQ